MGVGGLQGCPQRAKKKRRGHVTGTNKWRDVLEHLGRKTCPLWGSDQPENFQSDRGVKCSPAFPTLMRERVPPLKKILV